MYLVLAAYLLLTSVFLPAELDAQVAFSQRSYKSSDQGTASIVNGDFNGDGILDLVTVNSSTISFYRGSSGGAFGSPVQQSTPKNLGESATADLNGDGKLDLVIASNGNGGCTTRQPVSIFLGNGNGTFKEAAHVSVAETALYVALADFNGDHIPDIAVSVCNYSTGSDTSQTEVFLGNGDGTFRRSATLPYGGGQIATGDFNADGHQDIAVLTSSQLVIYLGDGTGAFQSPILTSIDTPFSLTVGDFYNDRIQSLALLTGVYNPDQTNFTYYASTARYKDGAVRTSSPQLVSQPNGGTFWQRIAGGDLNGDFKDDIVLVASQKFGAGALTDYMLGTGDGGFESPGNSSAYGEAEDFPFIRDLNLASRHDIGAAWTNGYMVTGGGALVLLNSNASTNCKPPKANALAIHICAPYAGETVASPFVFRAAGNAFNGIAKRMELWIDGRKIGQNLEDQLKVSASLAPGKHVASFIAIDSFDNHVTKPINFSVK